MLAIVLLFAGGYLSGCASLMQMEPPEITLSGIQLESIKGLETAFAVDLRVFNGGERPLTVKGLECDLTLNDRHLAKGVTNPAKEIPAYGSEVVRVMVYSSMVDMLGMVHQLIRSAQRNESQGKWRYRLEGHLRLADPGWLEKIPFDTQGEIDLKALVTDQMR